MKAIELKRIPRCSCAIDEDCIWELHYNGVLLGKWFGGEDKKYLNPTKWVDEQLPKRLKVLGRNINRLQSGVDNLLEERKKVMGD